ncbi:hypothetical protein GE061_012325 [Apolygus lucorum]|uniref:DDE-1 domain-containing protein n=1 Tax=Apolygus lucorum TaxID=248454 RepID=A0A8S9XS15_APOLU|nr:hypothetical protein GE061_012325 [Apolygus lucorum]
MDESGVKTVPNNLPKHVALTGKSDVSKINAAKHGPTVTAVCAMSAVGHYVPPLFIYSRKRVSSRDYLILIKVFEDQVIGNNQSSDRSLKGGVAHHKSAGDIKII